MNLRRNAIQNAVQVMHDCTATHAESVPIVETFEGKTVWEGVVEVFTLHDCKEAPRCYAWSFVEKNETQFVVVLHRPPVDSAIKAVRAYIASLGKK